MSDGHCETCEAHDREQAQQERDESSYEQGSRAAWLTMLGECLRQLGYKSDEASRAAWIMEREAVVNRLRSLCREFGDNDWPEDLHLGDVIDKHLADHLRSRLNVPSPR